MATANTRETHYTYTDINHVSVMVCADDIKVADHEGRRRVLKFGEVYVYLDTDGVTALLALLLIQPEAYERVELLDEMQRSVEILRGALEQKAV